VVGRGVLRFGDARYRKPRSKFRPFSDFCADPGILGVDIIYCNRMGWGEVCYVYLVMGYGVVCY